MSSEIKLRRCRSVVREEVEGSVEGGGVIDSQGLVIDAGDTDG